MIKSVLLSNALVYMCLSQSANAAPGDHLGTEQTVLIPRIDLATHYRSNVYLEEGEVGGGEPVQSSALLLVSPSANLTTQNDNLYFRLTGVYGLRRYMNQEYANLNRVKDGSLKLDSVILPNSKVGFIINDKFVSSARETNQVEAESAYIQQMRNELKSGFRIVPSGSLEIMALGGFEILDIKGVEFEGQEVPIINNRYTYSVDPTIRWAFLPKTDIFVRGSYRWSDWQFNSIDADPAVTPECQGIENCTIGVPDSQSQSTTVGIKGRLTDKSSLILTYGKTKSDYDESSVVGGNANDSYSTDLEFNNYSVRFELYPTEVQTLFLSYSVDFRDVYFTNYTQYKQLTAGFNGNLGRKLVLKSNAQYREDNYDGVVDRTDRRINVRNDFNYNVTNFSAVTAGVWWERLVSVDGFSELEYDDLNIHAGVSFTY